MKKKYLMVNDYILNIVLDKIKKIIGIDKFDNAEILIDTNYKLSDEFTFQNVVVIITCILKDDG